MTSAAIVAGLAITIFAYQYTRCAPAKHDFEFFAQQEIIPPKDVINLCGTKELYEKLLKAYQDFYDTSKRTLGSSFFIEKAEHLAGWSKPLDRSRSQFDMASCLYLAKSYKHLLRVLYF
jgi:hypothetical protein